MRILVDENFPSAAVAVLRAAGHDVAWIHTDAPGSRDVEVCDERRWKIAL